LKKINAALEEKIKNHEHPTDVVMLMLYEDSVKYSAITFSEITKKIIVFINGELKGKYLQLLRKNSLRTIVKKISESNPAKSKEYRQRLLDYENIWDQFFPSGANNKWGPKEQDLEDLKMKLEHVTQNLRDYRDRVAAHFDDEDVKKGTVPILLWTELEDIILHFQKFLVNFYFLLTHASIQCDDLDGIGFTNEENTVKSFISGIFRDSCY